MLAVFAGCGAKKPSGEKLHIIATIYPEYEWVKQITEGADNVELSLLLDNGSDLHNFQPSVKDITDISSSDVFIYNGGESDEWVDNIKENAQNKDMLTLDLMELLGDKAKEETAVEGMETEEHDEEEDKKEYDVTVASVSVVAFLKHLTSVKGIRSAGIYKGYNLHTLEYPLKGSLGFVGVLSSSFNIYSVIVGKGVVHRVGCQIKPSRLKGLFPEFNKLLVKEIYGVCAGCLKLDTVLFLRVLENAYNLFCGGLVAAVVKYKGECSLGAAPEFCFFYFHMKYLPFGISSEICQEYYTIIQYKSQD